MTSIQQRAELQRQIWQIANDVRGAVDGWDFKQYVLGTLFYRFISENFTNYITGGDESVNYAAMPDDDENIKAAKDTREIIGITKLNAELKTTVGKIDKLRTDIAGGVQLF
jgi:type I restriction-modification system DNA methylase subunit